MITEHAKQKGETIRGVFHLPVNVCSRCGEEDDPESAQQWECDDDDDRVCPQYWSKISDSK